MIIIMGPVGSGKGTQSDILAEKTGYTHLASGDLVRASANADQRKRMLKGEYLSTGEITALMGKALRSIPDPDKVVLDGIPRTVAQLEWLLQGVRDGQWKVEAVFHLVVSPEVIRERIRNRDREDDNEAAVAARMAFYHKETEPLLASFRQKGFQVYDIDGSQSVQAVHEAVLRELSGAGAK